MKRADHLLERLGSAGSLHRLRPDGARVEANLEQELDRWRETLADLFVATSHQVGLDPAADPVFARLPQETWSEWEPLWPGQEDTRRLEPLWVDRHAGVVVYRAVLGWESLRVRAEFVDGYGPEIVGGDGGGLWLGGHPDPCGLVVTDVPKMYTLRVPVVREVRIRADAAPPTDLELQALCDELGGTDAVVAALEAL